MIYLVYIFLFVYNFLLILLTCHMVTKYSLLWLLLLLFIASPKSNTKIKESNEVQDETN